MKSLLIFAHRKEAETFFERIEFKRIDFFFDNLFESSNYYLLICGEGLQNTTEKLSAFLAIFNNNIDKIYNLGVAGALNSNLKKNDILEVRTVYAHPYQDLEFKSFSSKANSKIDCISTNSRILDRSGKEKLARFADIVDRELWAVGSLAHLFKKEFSGIKIISDEVTDEEFCKVIINESKTYSDNLFEYFNKLNTLPIIKNKNDPEIYKNKALYFSVTQKRQYENLLHLLANKISENELILSQFFLLLLQKEITPKQRTKELITYLVIQLNPHHKKYYDKLDELIFKVTQNGININYDQNLEDSNIEINFKSDSLKDLNHKLSLISTLPMNEIQKVFNGEINV